MLCEICDNDNLMVVLMGNIVYVMVNVIVTKRYIIDVLNTTHLPEAGFVWIVRMDDKPTGPIDESYVMQIWTFSKPFNISVYWQFLMRHRIFFTSF